MSKIKRIFETTQEIVFISHKKNLLYIGILSCHQNWVKYISQYHGLS
jgi:hypothetical protein